MQGIVQVQLILCREAEVVHRWCADEVQKLRYGGAGRSGRC